MLRSRPVCIVTENGDQHGFIKFHGRVIFIAEIYSENSSDTVKVVYYRSSGTNEKIINGKEYSAEELKDKWFCVFGVTWNWIHKISLEMHPVITSVGNKIEELYQSYLKEKPEFVASMTNFHMNKINGLFKHPVREVRDEEDLGWATSLATANYGDILNRIALLELADARKL